MVMTLGQEISRMIITATEDRKRRLIIAGAPEVVIKSCDVHIQMAKTNVDKMVKGLSRKYKGAADEELIEDIRFVDTVGNYYKEGRKPTRVFRFVTTNATYYYDTFESKIEKINGNGEQYGLNVRLSEKDFDFR